jgi:LPS export ABC transporter protein LptC
MLSKCFFAWFFVVVSFMSCDEKAQELLDEEVYEGPKIEMKNVETLFSDSAVIRLKIIAPLQQIYDNGDENFPEGMNLEIYDKDGVLNATFRSNKASKNAEENYYLGEGNVIVKNLQNGDELNTEELYWYQAESLFKTEKFVTIKSEGELHTGEGLEATQDFSYYTIKKPTGTISIQDEAF